MLGYLYGLGSALSWSVAVLLFRHCNHILPPLSFNLFKNVIALFLFALTYLLWLPEFPLQVSQGDLMRILVSGFLGMGIADALYLKTLDLIGASRTAIVECVYAPTVFLLAFFLLGEAISQVQFAGMGMVVLAISLICYHRDPVKIPLSKLRVGIPLGCAAVFCIALGAIIVKPSLDRVPLLEIVFLRMCAGVMGSVLIIVVGGNAKKVFRNVFSELGDKTLIIASFFGTYLALILWLAGFKYEKATIVATLNQTSTIFTVLLAAIVLREKLSLIKCGATLLATLGVLVITLA